MATKVKHRKKSKASSKVTFHPAEDDVEAESIGGEEDGDPAADEGEDRGKKKQEEEEEEEEEFNLDEVLRLGGTQADYAMLAAMNDCNEIVDGGKKGAIDDLEEGELEKFIAKLGLRAFAGLQSIPDEPEGGGEKAEATKAGEENNPKKTKDAQKKKQNVNVFEFQRRSVLLIKPGGKWFDLEYAAEGTAAEQDASLVSQYKALAQQLFEADVALYKSKKILQKGANSNWMKTGRKLRPFAQHPFDLLEEKASGNRDSRDRRLVLWYFEHHLRHHVAEFVAALDMVAHDTVAATKAKALTTAHELLCSHPEQERALLGQVVNKLGDPEYKTAAKASHLLESLLHKHPNMKVVVCCEVKRLMFRPNICAKAQYYAVCFLSQVMLSHDEAELAAKLIAIYFSFFRACVKKKDVESKMLSGLLSGVNRAYPYAGGADDKVREQLDTLFKVVHLVRFNTAVQALMLLFQVMNSQQSVSDR
uniref:CCAAT enhancer binding protein zeta n=1 Tax=Cyclopterus lumpus TaxID=8103 RepID=A0A8C3G146_CYCLU